MDNWEFEKYNDNVDIHEFNWEPFYHIGRRWNEHYRTLLNGVSTISPVSGVLFLKNDTREHTYDVKMLINGTPETFKHSDDYLEGANIVSMRLGKCHNYLCNLGIEPEIIELSIFDPDDISARTFYTFLYAKNLETIIEYRNQMAISIEYHDKEGDRGLIVPDPRLYSLPFYLYKLKNEYISYKSTNGHKGNSESNCNFFCGSYEAPANFSQKSKELDNHIVSFCDEVIKYMRNSDIRIDTVFILPLLRPPATFSLGAEGSKYRGGSIIVFGNRNAKFNRDEFGFRLSHKVLYAIMDASQTLSDVLYSRNSKERAFVHALKRVYKKLSLLAKRPNMDKKTQIAIGIISEFLGYTFTWRQRVKYRAIDNSESLYRH